MKANKKANRKSNSATSYKRKMKEKSNDNKQKCKQVKLQIAGDCSWRGCECVCVCETDVDGGEGWWCRCVFSSTVQWGEISVSPLVSSSSRTTLLMSLSSDSSWILMLRDARGTLGFETEQKNSRCVLLPASFAYLLSPQEAALFSAGEMATLLRLSLWLWAW